MVSSSGVVGTIADGVQRIPLTMHRDDRGCFTELFRAEWAIGPDPVQWNLAQSESGVLRGVHVHPRHADYLVVVSGRAFIGLRDLRGGSPTAGAVALIEMSGGDLSGLVIPPGVAHGFLFAEPTVHVYAVSHYWDPADELGCHWADPDLAIPWPSTPSRVSERDARLPSLRSLVASLSDARSPAGAIPRPATTPLDG